jgi:hypothetical protein
MLNAHLLEDADAGIGRNSRDDQHGDAGLGTIQAFRRRF